MANDYSTMTTRLVAELAAGLAAAYAGIVVVGKVFKPNDLADFPRYCIVVSPNALPWDERRIGVPQVQYIMRADLWLLVKNFDEAASVYGTVAGSLGLFELINDVKTLLRLTGLSGLINAGNKTYDEPAGPLNFEGNAVQAFDSGEKAFIHRARLVYTARLNPFCHPRLP